MLIKDLLRRFDTITFCYNGEEPFPNSIIASPARLLTGISDSILEKFCTMVLNKLITEHPEWASGDCWGSVTIDLVNGKADVEHHQAIISYTEFNKSFELP